MLVPENNLRFLRTQASNPTAPLFVFLPGMDGTGKLLLGAQRQALEAMFDVRCLAIPPDDRSDWAELVAQTASLIRAERQFGGNRPVYICGESFGGCLALNLAAYAPDLCDRLILVNSASAFSRQPVMRLGAFVAQWLLSPFYQFSTVGLLPFLIEPKRVASPTQRALLTAMQSVTPEGAAWRLSLLSRFDLAQLPLQQMTQPVLVIAAAADRLLPSVNEADRLVRCLPNAQKTLLPKSGHACLLETPVRLAEILRSQQFLNQADRSSLVMLK